MADTDQVMIETLYARFNARDIEGVLALLAPDVQWVAHFDVPVSRGWS